MKTKKCGQCHKTKLTKNFYVKRIKTETTFQSSCIDCTKEYHRQHYKNNKKKYYKNKLKNKERAKKAVNLLKNKPCTDCGGSFPSVAMDFDHTKDNKVKNVAYYVASNSLGKALEELKKCELVCSNCHRVRTLNRRLASLTE